MQDTDKKIVVRKAEGADVEPLVTFYNQSLGKHGVLKPGCDPYPDPQLFTIVGMQYLLKKRDIFIATVDKEVIGAEIIEYKDEYHRELVDFTVLPKWRGKGVGSKIVDAITTVYTQKPFFVDITEFVTHNTISQRLHARRGFTARTGLALCKYGKVFSPRYHESTIYTTTIFQNSNLNGVDSLKKQLQERVIYLPKNYIDLARIILQQFSSLLSYVMKKPRHTQNFRKRKLIISDNDPYPNGYITIPRGFNYASHWETFQKEVMRMKRKGKHHIQITLSLNDQESPFMINLLEKEGFIFQALLPIGNTSKKDQAKITFEDMLLMQWVDPRIVEKNPLPSKKDSFIQLYSNDNTLQKILDFIHNQLQMHKNMSTKRNGQIIKQNNE